MYRNPAVFGPCAGGGILLIVVLFFSIICCYHVLFDEGDPCATKLCPVGSYCAVSAASSLAYCVPSCELANGGCPKNNTCKLIDVQCFTTPCPPQVQCIPPGAPLLALQPCSHYHSSMTYDSSMSCFLLQRSSLSEIVHISSFYVFILLLGIGRRCWIWTMYVTTKSFTLTCKLLIVLSAAYQYAAPFSLNLLMGYHIFSFSFFQLIHVQPCCANSARTAQWMPAATSPTASHPVTTLMVDAKRTRRVLSGRCSVSPLPVLPRLFALRVSPSTM